MGATTGLGAPRGPPPIEHVLERLRPQVDEVLINANRSQDRYRQLAPVIRGPACRLPGPLAGMLAGLTAARHDWVLFVPCDGPALPRSDGPLSRRRDPGYRTGGGPRRRAPPARGRPAAPCPAPPCNGRWPEGERKTGAWFARHRMAVVPFADQPDAFVNLNSPDELAAWEARLLAGETP